MARIEASTQEGWNLFAASIVRQLQKLEQLTASLERPLQRQRDFTPNSMIIPLIERLVDYIRHDELETLAASMPELLFRTVRLAILAGLACLEIRMRRCDSQWRHYLPVVCHAREEVSRATGLWLPYRTLAEGTGFRVLTLYNAAVQTAFTELSQLAEMPGVRGMLYDGARSIGTDSIASACEQILAVIHTRINLDVACRVWPTVTGGSLASLSPIDFIAFQEARYRSRLYSNPLCAR